MISILPHDQDVQRVCISRYPSAPIDHFFQAKGQPFHILPTRSARVNPPGSNFSLKKKKNKQARTAATDPIQPNSNPVDPPIHTRLSSPALPSLRSSPSSSSSFPRLFLSNNSLPSPYPHGPAPLSLPVPSPCSAQRTQSSHVPPSPSVHPSIRPSLRSSPYDPSGSGGDLGVRGVCFCGSWV